MFGLSKKEQVISLEKKLEKAISEAKHFYEMKSEIEEMASYELSRIAVDKGVSASHAAKTDEGKRLLYEVVLNRQYAFYLNETAIQLYAEIQRIKSNGTSIPLNHREWFDDIVSPVGGFIVKDQVDAICGSIIIDADSLIR